MNLAELWNEMCKKAGVKEDDPDLKNILSNAELSKVNIPTKLQEAIQGNLYDLQAAINSKDVIAGVKKVVEAQIFNGMDAELEKLIKAGGLDDEQIAEVKKGDSTYKKMASLSVQLEKAIAKKATSKDPDKDGLTKTINELKQQLADAKTEFDAKVAAEATKYQEKEFDLLLENFLGEYSYANEAVGKRPNVLTAKTIIKEGVAQDGAKLLNDNGLFKLVTQDGTDFYDSKTQTKVDFKKYAEQRIAPLLKVADPNAGKGAGAGSGGAGEGSTLPPRSHGGRSLEAAYAEIEGGK